MGSLRGFLIFSKICLGFSLIYIKQSFKIRLYVYVVVIVMLLSQHTRAMPWERVFWCLESGALSVALDCGHQLKKNL